jgi:lipopolysaccharide/colanic/teichoic acid biosynthesis glycosyltransferase
MHYLLGFEVWQNTEKIFLNQGKYAIKMKRFDMLKCKSMYTPMETKLKLLIATSSELVDAILYRQIGFCYFVQTNYWFSDVSDEY